MDENETNVAPEASAPEPAKTAEIATPIGAPGASAGCAGELAGETTVSMVIRIVREYLIANPPQIPAAQIDQLKAEIFAKVSELFTPIVAKSTEAVTPSAAPFQPAADAASRTGPTRGVMLEEVPHVLGVGDPVKVWADAEHKKFHTGLIAAVHGDGDAYDVTLDYDQSVTKVPADGLEFDDRR